MYKRLILILFCLFMQMLTADLAVNTPAIIKLKVAPQDSVAGRPVLAQIDIIRTKSQTVDASSFQSDGKSISVKLIREEMKAPKELFSVDDPTMLVVSTYTTDLGILPQGVRTFGPITATIGGVAIQSNIASFEVAKAVVSERFQLFADIKPKRIYPGQSVEFVYKIIFKDALQLTTETLPLFSLPQIQYEGSPVMNSYLDGDNNVQEISLKGRAEAAGNIDVPVSIAEGFIRKEDPATGVTLVPPLLRAEAPPFTFTVQPFPSGAPQNFFGALGAFALRSRMVNDGQISVGVPFDLEIVASGRGDFSTLSLSQLMNSSALQGIFSLSESRAPIMTDTTKQFLYQCTLLKPEVSLFPELQLTSFDPETGQYLSMRLPALALNVKGEVDRTMGQEKDEVLQPLAGPLERVVIPPVLLIIVPLCALLIFSLVWYLLKRRNSVQQEEIRSGYTLMLNALKTRSQPAKSLPLVKRALLLRLKESGLISDDIDEGDQLSTSGVVGEVKEILRQIDETLYKKQGSINPSPGVYDEASQVFTKIRKMKVER